MTPPRCLFSAPRTPAACPVQDLRKQSQRRQRDHKALLKQQLAELKRDLKRKSKDDLSAGAKAQQSEKDAKKDIKTEIAGVQAQATNKYEVHTAPILGQTSPSSHGHWLVAAAWHCR